VAAPLSIVEMARPLLAAGGAAVAGRRQLYREAERHEDYWTAGAILEFTESVVREMERQGLTRTQLAERLGVTPAYVTKVLRGKVNFTLTTMVRLARALSTDLQVRLAGSSRRKAVQAPGGAGRFSEVVATSSRPAALRSRQRGRGRTRTSTASGARTQ